MYICNAENTFIPPLCKSGQQVFFIHSEEFDNYHPGKEENHCHNLFFEYGANADKNRKPTSTVIGDRNPMNVNKNNITIVIG